MWENATIFSNCFRHYYHDDMKKILNTKSKGDFIVSITDIKCHFGK